jgi:hypothetical protein
MKSHFYITASNSTSTVFGAVFPAPFKPALLFLLP